MEFNDLDDAIERSSNKKTIAVLGLVVATIVVLAVITYLFFYENIFHDDYPSVAVQDEISRSDSPSVNVEVAPSQPLSPPPSEVAAENPPAQPQIPTQVAPAIPPAQTAPSAITSLKYTIKPLDKNISTCSTMRNGSWDMPKACADSLIDAIDELIATNSEIIALEVSGVVDNNPYAGPSAELKQEGLASFRAREAIILIARRFSNIAAFEGPSKQQANKRGFELKAYYLQN